MGETGRMLHQKSPGEDLLALDDDGGEVMAEAETAAAPALGAGRPPLAPVAAACTAVKTALLEKGGGRMLLRLRTRRRRRRPPALSHCCQSPAGCSDGCSPALLR